ncbi:MAG: class I SAM-dependent methyltransferase [bacterium]|nr:class I SAM-dependent methyltransferase [bacterium]
MGRIHLFELEDQAWFPDVIRDAGTAYLRFMAARAGQSAALAPKIAEVLERNRETRIVDLCSGGSGPIPEIVDVLAAEGREVTATLTDLYPNVDAFERVARESGGRIEAISTPVDATRIGTDRPGLRTLTNALHHFRPEAARQILQDAVAARQPIAVFEMVGRSPIQIAGILLVFLPVMLTLPFFRPFRWSWIPLTYLVPVIPLFVMWDGLVSCLRVYSEPELRSLIEGVEGHEGYDWEIGEVEVPGMPIGIASLVGSPRPA